MRKVCGLGLVAPEHPDGVAQLGRGEPSAPGGGPGRRAARVPGPSSRGWTSPSISSGPRIFTSTGVCSGLTRRCRARLVEVGRRRLGVWRHRRRVDDDPALVVGLAVGAPAPDRDHEQEYDDPATGPRSHRERGGSPFVVVSRRFWTPRCAAAGAVVGTGGSVVVGTVIGAGGGGTTIAAAAGWKAMDVRVPPVPTAPGYSTALTVPGATWRVAFVVEAGTTNE